MPGEIGKAEAKLVMPGRLEAGGHRTGTGGWKKYRGSAILMADQARIGR